MRERSRPYGPFLGCARYPPVAARGPLASVRVEAGGPGPRDGSHFLRHRLPWASLPKALPPSERMRPGSFGLLAHPVEGYVGGPMPAGPYETDPRAWSHLVWYNRRSGLPLRLSIYDPVGAPERFAGDLASGAVRVRTLGEILAAYGQRPEHKSLAPDRSPAAPATAGLLRHRPIQSSPVRTHLAGKEGNKLLERLTGVVTAADEYRTDYGTRKDPWAELVVPVLRQMGASEVVQQTNPPWRRAIERTISDGHLPKSAHRCRILEEAAIAFAREVTDLGAAASPTDVMTELLASPPPRHLPLCACGCGLQVRSSRATWYADAHRKRSERGRTSRIQ